MEGEYEIMVPSRDFIAVRGETSEGCNGNRRDMSSGGTIHSKKIKVKVEPPIVEFDADVGLVGYNVGGVKVKIEEELQEQIVEESDTAVEMGGWRIEQVQSCSELITSSLDAEVESSEDKGEMLEDFKSEEKCKFCSFTHAKLVYVRTHEVVVHCKSIFRRLKRGGESEAGVLSRFIPNVCVLCELEVEEEVRLGHMYAHILLRDIKCPHCTFCHDVQQCMETHLEQHRKQDAKTKGSMRSAKQFVLSDMTIYPGMTITSPAVEGQPKTSVGEVKREKECSDKMNMRSDEGIISCSYCSMSNKIELNVLTHEVLVHRELVDNEIVSRDVLVLYDLKRRYRGIRENRQMCKLCGSQRVDNDDRFLSHLTHHVKRFSVGCDCCTFSSTHSRHIATHMALHWKLGKYDSELQSAIQFVRECGCESLGTSSPGSDDVNCKTVGAGDDNRKEMPSSSISTLNISNTDKRFPYLKRSKLTHFPSKERGQKMGLHADMDNTHSKKANTHGKVAKSQMKNRNRDKKQEQMKSKKHDLSDRSGAGEFSCAFCDFSHQSIVYTLTHEVIHHRACVNSCLQGFDRSGRVDVDVSRYYAYITTCILCGYVCNHSRLDHILNHINPGMYKCNICTFSSMSVLVGHKRQHLKQDKQFKQTLIDARLAAGSAGDTGGSVEYKGGGVNYADNEENAHQIKDADDTHDIDDVDGVDERADDIDDGLGERVDGIETSTVAGTVNYGKEMNLLKAERSNEKETNYGAKFTLTNTYEGLCGSAITSNTSVSPQTANASNTPSQTANTSQSNSSLCEDMFMDDVYRCPFCSYICKDKELVILHALSHENDKSVIMI